MSNNDQTQTWQSYKDDFELITELSETVQYMQMLTNEMNESMASLEADVYNIPPLWSSS